MRHYVTSDVVPYFTQEWKEGFTLLYFLIPQGTSWEWEWGPAGWHQNTKHMVITRLGPTAVTPPYAKQKMLLKVQIAVAVCFTSFGNIFLREKWNRRMHLQKWSNKLKNQIHLNWVEKCWNPELSVARRCMWVSHYTCSMSQKPETSTFNVCGCSLL